ncbi:MAG: hypothetical protein WCH34_09010 [Bacteroidota bacterium]
MAKSSTKNFIYTLLFAYAAIAIFTICFFNGTGDAGDSIQHYLFAKYAPQHPELFFHHWAKPVYVLLVSPFAHFGFIGVKICNAILSFFSILFTYLIVKELKFKNAELVALFMIFTPLYYVLTFSGLTEPMFAFFIGLGLYLIVKNHFIAACLLISFLPFVRSEGLIILGIFALYFLLKRKWKVLPFLLTGHILYSIAGYFVYHDILWVFTKIPYAHTSNQYGSGELFHYVNQLLYVIGVPLFILFWLGFISLIFSFIKKKIQLELHVIVFLGFLSFFVAHSVFWYLGIFGSMGLKRVLLGVIPFIAIISLQGLNFLTENILSKWFISKRIFQFIFVSYILIFPFIHNPASIDWKRDMTLTNDQQIAISIAKSLPDSIKNESRFIYSHPYLGEALNIDPFNPQKRLELNAENLEMLQKRDVIIWDNWFSVVENGISQDKLDNNPDLIKTNQLNTSDKGREKLFAVYIKKNK